MHPDVAYETHNGRQRAKSYTMRNIFRALLAGYGARKLGGGCITTIILFIIIFWLLGYLF
jgi:hypothetical protein